MDKLRTIKELYAEDKLIQNQFDYSLNEFFGTIQIGLKNIESRSLRVTKNPTMKYVVYEDNKEIAYLDNSKGTVFYDDSSEIFNRFTNLKRESKKNPEQKEKLNSILQNPNMSFFPVEEIEFTQEERNEIFRSARGRTAALVVKYYRSIHQDNLVNINYNDSSIPINFNGKDDENDFNRILKNDFPSVYNKYGVILAKLALDGELANGDDLTDFKASLLQMIQSEGEDNVDETLNGLNVQQIIDKYGLSLATEEDAMVARIFAMERKPSTYKIVPITSYQDSQKYAKYFKGDYVSGDRPSAWCVTEGSHAFENYTDSSRGKGELFYYLLREPDWDKKFTIPRGENRDIFDSYATSMIAVSIKQNGMIHTATSRYNHGISYKGSTDNVYNEEDISRLLGRPIFEALPPLNPINTPVAGDQSKVVLQKGITLLKAPQGNRKIIQYQDGYYLFMDNLILKDRKTKKLFKFNNIKKIKNSSGDLSGYLFYYDIQQRDGTLSKFIMGLDKNLKMIIPSNSVTKSDNSLEKELAKSILEKISYEEE